jgi:plastocyanin
MSYKSYRNKVKSLVCIAALLVIIAAIDLIYIPTNHYTAQGQSSSQTNNNNATTQIQVGGGNATYPFFGYNPQTVQISVGSKVVWTTPSLDFAEPHTVSFILNNKTMAATFAPFVVPSSTKFSALPPGSNSEPNMIPGIDGMNTVIVSNARSYNPAVMDSTGNTKIAPPNASFTISGNERYVNSGWLIPKTQEKAYPGSSNTFAVTFQKSGTYGYLCELHPWMSGMVIVK